MKRYVRIKEFLAYTADEFYEYAKSLYVDPISVPFSKSADGIRITKGKRGLIFKCTRGTKQVTTQELAQLAHEYKIEPSTLTAEFTKRRFTITNVEGEVTNAKPKATRRSKRTKPIAEANAHLEQAGSADNGANQLFKS